VLHVSQISVNSIPTLSVLQFIFTLSPMTNGTLHHQYIVGALKIIIYDNIIIFCLQTSEMYVKLNII